MLAITLIDHKECKLQRFVIIEMNDHNLKRFDVPIQVRNIIRGLTEFAEYVLTIQSIEFSIGNYKFLVKSA